MGTKEAFVLDSIKPREFKISQRAKAKARADGKCERCGKESNPLYIKKLVVENFNIRDYALDFIRRNCAENLLCLCKECLELMRTEGQQE